MTLSRVIGPGAVAFLAFWGLFLAAGRSSFFRDPGTFWHTVVGDRLRAGGFLDTDPFTFTFAGAKWIPHQWLGEVTMSVAHGVAGFDTLLLLTATTLAALFAWLAVRLLNTGLHPVVVGGVVLLAVAAGASHFHVRPHLATIVGVAVTAAFLTDLDAGRIGLGRFAWLVPVFAVWTNFHGGMLGGLAMLGLCGAGWLVWWWGGVAVKRTLASPPGGGDGRPPIHSVRTLSLYALICAACGLTAFANPYGVELPRAWLGIMDSPVLPRIIKEHSRLTLTEAAAWPVVALAGVYLLVLAGVPVRRLRVSWLLPLFWLVQAYGRVRHAPLFAVSALVAVAAIWPHTRWAAWLAAHRPDFQTPLTDPPPRTPWWANVWLPAACVLLALGLQLAKVPAPLVGVGWAKLDPATWPVDLLDVLREHERAVDGRPPRVFTEYTDGGFVIYHAPGYRVFVDDRCELFGDRWLLEFLEAEHADTAAVVAGWEAKYGSFDAVLTRTGSGFDQYFSRNLRWVLEKRTETGSFYRLGGR